MTHIAITEELDGKRVEWMEKVSDAQYRAPVHAQGATTPAPVAQPRPSQAAIGDFSPKLNAITAISVAKEVFQKN